MTLVPAELAKNARERSKPHSIEVLDTVTRYWSYPSVKPDAKVIIFIHGYRGNHHGLEAIAGALDDFNIIIPDLPGFGESTPFATEHTIDQYAAWLSAFIEKLAPKQKPILLGHSFGSIVCAAFASKTDAIELLILENPVSAPALKGPNAPITKIAQGFFAIAGRLPLKQGEWLLKSWPMVRGMSIIMTKSWNRDLRKWVHAQHDENFNDFANRRVAIEGYKASISHNVSDYAKHFRVPVLLIIGSRDDITSPKQQFEMSKTILTPHSISQHMGVGHLTHYEIPSEVAEDIRLFVSQQNADTQ
jgi:pimeloyl-ACP methyl ester carboxylesterase